MAPLVDIRHCYGLLMVAPDLANRSRPPKFHHSMWYMSWMTVRPVWARCGGGTDFRVCVTRCSLNELLGGLLDLGGGLCSCCFLWIMFLYNFQREKQQVDISVQTAFHSLTLSLVDTVAGSKVLQSSQPDFHAVEDSKTKTLYIFILWSLGGGFVKKKKKKVFFMIWHLTSCSITTPVIDSHLAMYEQIGI